MITFPVFFTEAYIVSVSRGDKVRKSIRSAFIIHHLIVSTTSHQAMSAPLASAIIANVIAHASVSAFDHTAGHILFAISFAHIFIAM